MFYATGCSLLRLICVIVSFQIGSNLVGKSRAINSSKGYINMKKSAINNWSSYFMLQFSVEIRGLNLIELQINALSGNVLCNSIRIGIEAICSNNIVILCFGIVSVYSIKLCVKIISNQRLSMIRSLLATR